MTVRVAPLNISFQERGRSMNSVVEAIRRHLRENPGNNLIYCPSFAYLDQLHQRLTALGILSFAQRTGMAESERKSFLAKFTDGTGLVGLAVMGGIFAEGIDLPGEQLVGITVISVGLPGLSIERDLLATYFDQKRAAGIRLRLSVFRNAASASGGGPLDSVRRRSRGGPVGRSPLPRTQIRKSLPNLVEGHPGLAMRRLGLSRRPLVRTDAADMLKRRLK